MCVFTEPTLKFISAQDQFEDGTKTFLISETPRQGGNMRLLFSRSPRRQPGSYCIPATEANK